MTTRDDDFDDAPPPVDGIVDLVARLVDRCPVILLYRYGEDEIYVCVDEHNDDALSVRVLDADTQTVDHERVLRWHDVAEAASNERCRELHAVLTQQETFDRLLTPTSTP